MAKGTPRQRECIDCGASFTGRYRKCPSCRPYRTERQCSGCSSTFRGETLKCSGCQASERQCITCGATFTSRYQECRPCRTKPARCQVAGCEEPKVRGRGSRCCQKHRDDAYQRALERLAKTTCYMAGCTEPKLAEVNAAGRRKPYRYCARHSAEAPLRERAQITRRARERQYGITHDEFLQMLEAQGGVCAICGNGNDGPRQLSIDHDHETGAIRALLCDRCNPMLGYARDNVAVLQAAIAYLEHYADQVLIPAGV